jgi:hypothetical protein
MRYIRSLKVEAIYGAAVFILFFVAAFINGCPILYPDGVGYFHAGYSLLNHLHLVANHTAPSAAERGNLLSIENRDGISTAGSVYYDVVYAATYGLFGEWMLPLLQVRVASIAIALVTAKLILSDLLIGSADIYDARRGCGDCRSVQEPSAIGGDDQDLDLAKVL